MEGFEAKRDMVRRNSVAVPGVGGGLHASDDDQKREDWLRGC